jgi:3-oxoacyl-[acyl-carrier protein] reductase
MEGASIDSRPSLTQEKPEAGRVAIVTGAGGGIAAGVSGALSRQGMHIVAVDIDGPRAEAAAQVLVAAGGDAIALVADARHEASASAAVETAFDHFRRIDVLVNLAGLMRNAMMHKVTDEDFMAVLESQALGSLHFMKAVTPHMKQLGYGRIVNMSSIAARGTIGGVSYGAAKGAIEAMTKSAALELAPRGVTVNCVAPGLVNAGMFLTTPEEYRQHMVARIPVGRMATTDDVAAAVRFLASTEAGYITGQTLTVCGGLTLGF